MALTARHRVSAALLASAMLLAACSSDTADDSASASASESASASATASGAAEETASAEPVEKGDETGTTVEGEFGRSATMSFAEGEAPTGLQVEVVSEGGGPEVGPDDTVVAHYAGQVWQGDVFDSSFERGTPAAFSLNGVVKGWKEGLTGVPVGSRVLISIPPELGYGEAGQPAAGISGTDTIVFTVDVLDAYPPGASGDPEATPTGNDVPVTYSGELGEPVTDLKVEEGTPEPTEPQTVVIAEGSGEPVGAAAEGTSAILAYTATSWDGQFTESTHDYQQSITVPLQGSYFEGLAGVPVGSRVLVLVPGRTGESTQPTPALAAVVDVIGQVAPTTTGQGE